MSINRPNIADFLELSGTDWNLYCRELSNYCDELEIALDKACQLLQDIEKDNCVYCPLNNKLCVDEEEKYDGHCKKERWKEYLLNERI